MSKFRFLEPMYCLCSPEGRIILGRGHSQSKPYAQPLLFSFGTGCRLGLNAFAEMAEPSRYPGLGWELQYEGRLKTHSSECHVGLIFPWVSTQAWMSTCVCSYAHVVSTLDRLQIPVLFLVIDVSIYIYNIISTHIIYAPLILEVIRPTGCPQTQLTWQWKIHHRISWFPKVNYRTWWFFRCQVNLSKGKQSSQPLVKCCD